MKQLLGIVVLGLLLKSNAYADVKNVLKKIKSNKDIAIGFKKFIDTPDNNKRNNWRLTRQKEIFKSKPETIKHILQIVKKSEGYPVRLGKESIRF
jgi:hypothetical protein